LQWAPIVRLRQTNAWRWVARLLLFNAVCIGWVFFRANSFANAFTVFHQLTVPGALTLAAAPVMLALFFGLFGQFQPLRWRKAVECELSRWPAMVRGAAFASAIFVIELLGPTGVAPFIYFQF
jgi:alginate O-acetyltransferase complex protein AlgI